jgi:Cu+-exporting ATPase
VAQFCARYSFPTPPNGRLPLTGLLCVSLPAELRTYSLALRLHLATLAVESTIAQKSSTKSWYALIENGEAIMNNTTAVKDPVCGMDVEIATSAGRTEHNGQTYYFCGLGCKAKFDLNPEQYSGKTAGRPQSGHSCCS